MPRKREPFELPGSDKVTQNEYELDESWQCDHSNCAAPIKWRFTKLVLDVEAKATKRMSLTLCGHHSHGPVGQKLITTGWVTAPIHDYDPLHSLAPMMEVTTSGSSRDD